jgi:hypothetical protein
MGLHAGANATQRNRDMDALIVQNLRENFYPPQTEARAAAQLRQCATSFGLLPTVSLYPPFERPEKQERLVVLRGNLPIVINGKRQGIPLCVYALRYFPDTPPVIVVTPPDGLAVPRQHPCVRPSGAVRIVELDPQVWHERRISLYAVLDHLSREFARCPPLEHDPQVFERQRLAKEVEGRVRAKLEADTLLAQQEHAELSNVLREAQDLPSEIVDADTLPPVRALPVVREERRKLETLIDLYGMRDGDISVTEYCATIDGGDAEQKALLKTEDTALQETMDILTASLGIFVPGTEQPVVTVDQFFRASQELATEQFELREELRRLDRAQINVVAEAVSTATPSGTAIRGAGGRVEELHVQASALRRQGTLSPAQ